MIRLLLFCIFIFMSHNAFCSIYTIDDTTKSNFYKCFADVDTAKKARVKGCYNTFYKIINKKYVLSIKLDTIIYVGKCANIVESKAGNDFTAALYIYDNNKANLNDICTDVFIVNNARPSRKLISRRGAIIFGVSGTSDYYGMKTAVVSILVKRITFYDKRLGKSVTIENELFWKVLNVLSEQG